MSCAVYYGDKCLLVSSQGDREQDWSWSSSGKFTFTFIHLADAFIQNDLQLLYVRGRMPLEQLGVKCLAQGHSGVSHKKINKLLLFFFI